MDGLSNSLSEAIGQAFGTGTGIRRRVPVAGGDINDACFLELSDGSRVFMKTKVITVFHKFKRQFINSRTCTALTVKLHNLNQLLFKIN